MTLEQEISAMSVDKATWGEQFHSIYNWLPVRFSTEKSLGHVEEWIIKPGIVFKIEDITSLKEIQSLAKKAKMAVPIRDTNVCFYYKARVLD